MKNIHILPTDQQTGIFETNIGLQFSIMNKVRHGEFKGYHIYITSDEEIKDGDWMIRGNEQPTLVTPNFFWDFGVRYYKIILTTDPTLIADGVQDIDDEFLGWFVKNYTCEFVEMNKKLVEFPLTFKMMYKIIIPQEESKPIDNLEERFKRDMSLVSLGEETLEEAAELCIQNGIYLNEQEKQQTEIAFYEGANWQAERMYSEEELLQALSLGFTSTDETWEQCVAFAKEQFKKK